MGHAAVDGNSRNEHWRTTMSGMISYARPDGKASSGYMVEPTQGSNAPGVVVIQEWWGF